MDDDTIFFDRSPAEAGPALILVHGSGGDHTHWPEPLRRHPGIQVFAPDLPGHGRSPGAGCSSVEAYARVIDRFARSLGVQSAAVAGHSLGGAVALTLALMNLDWLSGIVLVGTGARLRVHPQILAGFATAFEETVDRVCRESFGPAAPAPLIAEIRRQLLGNDPRVIQADYEACDRFDVMDQIGGIACPALVISAAEDRMTPAKYGAYLLQEIPRAAFTLIPGAGHMMTVEKPGEVTAAVAGFMGISPEG
jgi:pimeloyl-ACP methyl ester carboxylesterase